jgi:conjugal transfer ATP-binding protein TraC
VESVKAAQFMLQRQPLSEILPYLAFDDENEVYCLDHGVGVVYECSPLIFAGTETAMTLRGILESNFPEKTSLQIAIIGSKNVKPILDAYVHLRENTHGDSLYSTMAKKYRDFILQGTEKSIIKGCDVRVRDFRLLVSLVLPTGRTPEAYEAGIEKIGEMKDTLSRTLNTLHLHPTFLQPEGLINTLFELLNPNHELDDPLRYDPNIPLNQQVLAYDNSIQVEKDHVSIDGKTLKSFTIQQYPEEWDISNGINFCGDIFQNVRQIDAPFVMTLNAEWPDMVRATDTIRKKQAAASYQAFGPLGKHFPRLQMQKTAFDEFLVKLEHQETPFYAYLNLFIYGDDKRHATSVSSVCQSLYRSMGLTLQEDSYIMLPLFIQGLPMGYLADAQREAYLYHCQRLRARTRAS